MTDYIQWVLRQDDRRCGHPIPIPVPTQTGTVDDPLGTPTGGPSAAFLCPECGLVKLYSRSDAGRELAPKPSPYQAGEHDLVYIEVGCDGNNCESLTKVHVGFHASKGTFVTAKPMNKWVFDEYVKCEHGHRAILDPLDTYQFYRAWMPF